MASTAKGSGAGMSRDHAVPVQRQRPLQRRFPLDGIGVVDGEPRGNSAELIEVDREDDLLLRQHLLNPHDRMRAVRACPIDCLPHFPSDLRRIGRAGAQYDLHPGLEVTNRANQVENPFLTRDPSHEEHERNRLVDQP